MKRMVPVFAVMAILRVPCACAQQVGVTGGLNIASLTNGPYKSPKDGLVIGGFANWRLTGDFSVEPQLLFSMKGAAGTYPQLPGTAQSPSSSIVTLDYIEIPILLKANLFTLPILPAGFDVFAGPDFAFNVYSHVTRTYNNPLVTLGGTPGTRTFSFNIAVGGGPNFTLGPVNLGVELRYTIGTDEATAASGFYGRHNNVWSIMASAGL